MKALKTLWTAAWGVLAIAVWLTAVGLGYIADGLRGALEIVGR